MSFPSSVKSPVAFTLSTAIDAQPSAEGRVLNVKGASTRSQIIQQTPEWRRWQTRLVNELWAEAYVFGIGAPKKAWIQGRNRSHSGQHRARSRDWQWDPTPPREYGHRSHARKDLNELMDCGRTSQDIPRERLGERR